MLLRLLLICFTLPLCVYGGQDEIIPDLKLATEPNLENQKIVIDNIRSEIKILRSEMQCRIFKNETFCHRLQVKLPTYLKFIIESLRLYRKDIRLDLILQVHPLSGEYLANSDVQFSQNLIRKIFEQERYQMSVFEGGIGDRVSLDSVILNILAYNKDAKLRHSPFMEKVRKELMQHASYVYSLENDTFLLTGGELMELYDMMGVMQSLSRELNFFVLEKISNKEKLKIDFLKIDDAINHLRSYIALALAIRKSIDFKISKTSIVIGAWHNHDIIPAMKAFGIHSMVFQTASSEIQQRFPSAKITRN